MYIGHYGVAYMIKRSYAPIPLWLLFLSVQLLDILAFILVIFGMEKASYTPNENPFFRTDLYLPFSHSLEGALCISALVFAAFRFSRKKEWAWILALGVLSHWVIDLLVHTADLPVMFNTHKVGLGLWNYPYVAL